MFFKKDFIVKYLLVILFWLLPVLANAACWEKFATSKDESIYFIDACSIAVDGIYKKAWFKTELQIPEENSDGKTYDSTKYLYYFNCKNRKSAIAQFTKYYIDDVVNSLSRKIEERAFNEVVPDSIGEAIFERACSTKITKKPKPDVLDREPFDFKNLNDSKECWVYVFTEPERNDVYVNKCSVSSLDKRLSVNQSYIKIYIKSSNYIKGKLISESGDKEYYDTIKAELLIKCNIELTPFVSGSNYYHDDVFVAKTLVPDVYIKFTPEKTKIIQNVLCSSLSKESTTQTNDAKVIKKTDTDELPAKFCWKDIHSNKDVDFYYDNCNFTVDKNSKHITSWIRTVTSKNYKSEVFGEYDEVVKKIDFDCINLKAAVIQRYYYSIEPANKIIHKEKNKEIRFTTWAVAFDKDIHNKAFEIVCKL
jgi:hypothetical protein